MRTLLVNDDDDDNFIAMLQIFREKQDKMHRNHYWDSTRLLLKKTFKVCCLNQVWYLDMNVHKVHLTGFVMILYNELSNCDTVYMFLRCHMDQLVVLSENLFIHVCSSMLMYGCTRLEIGVQSVYEDVARDTNRWMLHIECSKSLSFNVSFQSWIKMSSINWPACNGSS